MPVCIALRLILKYNQTNKLVMVNNIQESNTQKLIGVKYDSSKPKK
jgi:hypothetical protein